MDPASSREVVLVDASGNDIGTMEKLEAHRRGLLHRAFSIFIFDDLGRMLIQQRASEKYHSGGLWSNACCSHPAPGETVGEAAERRLREELGFSCPLTEIFTFTYRAEVGNGLIENEFDHVLIGYFDGEVHPDPAEILHVRWIAPADLLRETDADPSRFSCWFRIALPEVLSFEVAR